MMGLVIKVALVFISILTLYKLHKLHKDSGPKRGLQKRQAKRCGIAGLVANIADTIGIGSFAVLVAFDRSWSLLASDKLPGTLNAHSILPALVQSLVFLHVVSFDFETYAVLLAGATLGGFTGGYLVANLDRRKVRPAMFCGYAVMAVLVLANQLNLLPIGGELLELQGLRLGLGFLALYLVGIFPALGVGGYAPTQIALFLLGMAPLVAFPIMTSAGLIQQAVATLTFASKKQVATREAFLLGAAGVVGTVIAIPLVTAFSPYYLRWLLLGIIVYNLYMLARPQGA